MKTMNKHIFHYDLLKDNTGEEIIVIDKTDEKILNMLKENPLITQDEIGVKLQLTQPSVSVRLKNLKLYFSIIFTKKYIIMNELKK